jgi:hypothetical protein
MGKMYVYYFPKMATEKKIVYQVRQKLTIYNGVPTKTHFGF